MKCENCYHKWESNLNFPNQCPLCKSHSWWIERPSQCDICNKTFDILTEHHIDGNRKNYNKLNRMKICYDCHATIHNGLKEHNTSRRRRTYLFHNNPTLKNNREIVYRLKYLRNIWLLNKKEEKEGTK